MQPAGEQSKNNVLNYGNNACNILYTLCIRGIAMYIHGDIHNPLCF